MEDMKQAELTEFLERMRDYKARHTELITVLVPAGFDINLITKQLESEKSTAANIVWPVAMPSSTRITVLFSKS